MLEASPKHRYPTVAYNGQVPGPLLRMKQGRAVTVDIHNHSADAEIVHWHGLFLPVDVDGAMEEGSPMIAPGASTRINFTPPVRRGGAGSIRTWGGDEFRKVFFFELGGCEMIEHPPTECGKTLSRTAKFSSHCTTRTTWGALGAGSPMLITKWGPSTGKMLGIRLPK